MHIPSTLLTMGLALSVSAAPVAQADESSIAERATGCAAYSKRQAVHYHQ